VSAWVTCGAWNTRCTKSTWRAKPPRRPWPTGNADRLAEFETLDTAFHVHLESLATASRANDLPKTVEALSAALLSCQGCHSQFR
jgi:hypothetical protein